MEDPGLIPLIVAGLVAGAVCAAFGAYVSRVRGRAATEGLLFGLFLGPIGVLIAALLPAGDVDGPASPSRGADPFDPSDTPEELPWLGEIGGEPPASSPVSTFLRDLEGRGPKR